MPFMSIITNVPESKIPSKLVNDLTDLLSSILDKPKEYCSVEIKAGAIVNFGGSHEPSALVTVISIGRMGPMANAAYSAVITNELEDQLGVLPFQTYIRFVDSKLSALAHVTATDEDDSRTSIIETDTETDEAEYSSNSEDLAATLIHVKSATKTTKRRQPPNNSD